MGRVLGEGLRRGFVDGFGKVFQVLLAPQDLAVMPIIRIEC